MGKSEEKTDFWGNKYTQHYDDDGNESGRTTNETDFWGNNYEKHVDNNGNETGRTTNETDFWGNNYEKHVDNEGNEIGRTTEETDFWGNNYEKHVDNEGDEIGRTTGETDFWGNNYEKTESSKKEKKDNTQKNGSRHTDYESSSSGSWCYLSTACTKAMQLDDDCYQLQVLRKFRDEYVLKKQEGDKLIKEYYETAPQIISAINSTGEGTEIFNGLFTNIEYAVKLIENGQYEEAYSFYCHFAQSLRAQYLAQK